MQRVLLSLALLVSLVGLDTSAATALQPLTLREQQALITAQNQMAERHFDAALKSLAPFLARSPHHPLFDFSRGSLDLLQDRPAEALPWFVRTLEQDPDALSAWLNRAQCHYRLGQFGEAATAFERCFALQSPPQPQWRYNAALAWLQAGDHGQAEILLGQLLDEFADQIKPDWRAALVQSYLARGRADLAIPQLEALSETTTDQTQRRWREILVHQYLQLGRKETAQRYLERLVAEDGLEARWWRLLAHLHLESQQYHEGFVTLQVANLLVAGDEREQQLMADLCLQLGIPQQALERLKALQASDPQDSRLLNRLATASLQCHQPQQALAWLEQIPAPQPDAVRELRAQLLFLLERYEEAGRAYRQLAESRSGPSAGSAWLLAGYAAWNREDWSGARQALQRASRYGKQQATARRLLEQLPQ
ncbi:MAG: tetratricopeptide repeat protein [Desulfuromonadaceae bacterium]|nr:tetratricopeptide repeat protein [Desulfuromonadaceae bacterium]